MTSTLSSTPRVGGGLSDAPLSSRNNNNHTNGSVIQRLSSFRSTTSSSDNNNNSNSKRHHSLRLFRRSSSNSSSATSKKKASSSSSAMNNNKIKAPLHTKQVDEVEEDANDSTMRLEDDEQENTPSAALAENVVQWMQVACPDDVLPKVLAFMGPQKTAALSRTNRFWRAVMQSEGTWRLLCEELYKWKHGDEEPESWAEHYRLTPCVPVDYSTVHKALAVACAPAPKKSRRFASSSQTQPLRPQIRPLTILLRPGNHYLQETIVIETTSSSSSSTSSATTTSTTAAGPTISIQAVQMPENLFRPKMKHCERMDPYEELPEAPQLLLSGTSTSSSSSFSSTTSRSKSFRNFMRCHKETVDETATFQQHPPPPRQRQNQHYPFSELERRNSRDSSSSSNSDYWRSASATTTSPPPPRRACLVFRSKKTNEPAIRVRQGSLLLQHVDVAHHSDGLDIWNGNAAIQVQPAVAEDGLTIPPAPSASQPTAVLTGVHVTSATGRGVVNIDGGRLILRDSAVTDCAATGVYIGGPGSHAAMERCDVLRNGLGNQSTSNMRSRGATAGIARGHSGVYLEQGVARIVDCNISRNTLTGISVVSPDNASLQLQASDLMANGTNQLELPAAGSWARQESVVTQNSLSVLGRGRTRSGLAVEQAQASSSSNASSSSQRRRQGQANAFLHHHY